MFFFSGTSYTLLSWLLLHAWQLFSWMLSSSSSCPQAMKPVTVNQLVARLFNSLSWGQTRLRLTVIRLALVCAPWPENWVCYHFSSDRWLALPSNWSSIPVGPTVLQVMPLMSMRGLGSRVQCSELGEPAAWAWPAAAPHTPQPCWLSAWHWAYGCRYFYNHLLSLSHQHLSHWNYEPRYKHYNRSRIWQVCNRCTWLWYNDPPALRKARILNEAARASCSTHMASSSHCNIYPTHPFCENYTVAATAATTTAAVQKASPPPRHPPIESGSTFPQREVVHVTPHSLSRARCFLVWSEARLSGGK